MDKVIMSEIDKRISNVEKTCENCEDYMVCVTYNTLKTNGCESWQISFDLFNSITADIFKK